MKILSLQREKENNKHSKNHGIRIYFIKTTATT